MFDKILKKELPDSNDYPVIPPDMNYIYFQNCRKFKFKPKSNKLSYNNLWWLAESSFLVYNHPGFAKLSYRYAGLNQFKFFNGTGTECMIAKNKKLVIVTFRGTELKSPSAIHELWTDLNAKPTDFKLGGKVHNGFLKALYEIWEGENGLFEYLKAIYKENKKRPIWITGHSLGGALAALCFTLFNKAHSLVMFGAPRVGDKDFVNLTKDRLIWRVENRYDPIVSLPPNLPKIKFEFKDMGDLVYINNDMEFVKERPNLTPLEQAKIAKKVIKDHRKERENLSSTLELTDHIKTSILEWKDYLTKLKSDTTININDHMPIYYATLLWNKLVK